MKTAITEIFGIEHPIIQGGIGSAVEEADEPLADDAVART